MKGGQSHPRVFWAVGPPGRWTSRGRKGGGVGTVRQPFYERIRQSEQLGSNRGQIFVRL